MAARKITCLKCGALKPTPHQDAAQGLYERRTHGALRGSAFCDYCGLALSKGDAVIALTTPSDAPAWEHDYVVPENPVPTERAESDRSVSIVSHWIDEIEAAEQQAT